MIDVPASVDEITPDWINAVLFDHRPPRVTALKATSINNDRGFLSQSLRLASAARAAVTAHEASAW